MASGSACMCGKAMLVSGLCLVPRRTHEGDWHDHRCRLADTSMRQGWHALSVSQLQLKREFERLVLACRDCRVQIGEEEHCV